MIEEKLLKEFIDGLSHGFRENFATCKVINEAVSYPRKIPKSFWEDPYKGEEGFFGYNNISKQEMYVLREEIINAVVQRIISSLKNREVYSDNYTRYFHALTVLNVPKDDRRIPPKNRDNYMYNIALSLWQLDDGTAEKYKNIDAVSWYAAEVSKTK